MWKNEWVMEGGEEMIESIIKIVRIVDKTYATPEEWKKNENKMHPKKRSKEKDVKQEGTLYN